MNDFLAAVSNDNLDAVAEELAVLRKKCSRSEEYLAELNERYRNAELRNKKLNEVVAELKSELAVHPERGQAKKGDKAEELKNLVKRNTELEQKCKLDQVWPEMPDMCDSVALTTLFSQVRRCSSTRRDWSKSRSRRET